MKRVNYHYSSSKLQIASAYDIIIIITQITFKPNESCTIVGRLYL